MLEKSIEKLSICSRISHPMEIIVLNIVAKSYKTIGLVLGRTPRIRNPDAPWLDQGIEFHKAFGLANLSGSEWENRTPSLYLSLILCPEHHT